jgi:hypothetical protein
MTRHRPAATTHTVMLTQLSEINARLADRPRSSPVTPDDLGVLVTAVPGARPPAVAVLDHLSCSGDPEWPLIEAHFDRGWPGGGSVAVRMHTPSLRRLSKLLGLRQVWGI